MGNEARLCAGLKAAVPPRAHGKKDSQKTAVYVSIKFFIAGVTAGFVGFLIFIVLSIN